MQPVSLTLVVPLKLRISSIILKNRNGAKGFIKYTWGKMIRAKNLKAKVS